MTSLITAPTCAGSTPAGSTPAGCTPAASVPASSAPDSSVPVESAVVTSAPAVSVAAPSGLVHHCRCGGLRARWHSTCNLVRRSADDGMATAEYAVVTVAAAAFAGLLIVVLRSDEVRGLLMGIIRGALSV
jgi:hypothetical protein